MLMQYKGGAEDEECPVPGDIRDELLDFHNDLLAHCGEGGDRDIPLGLGTTPRGTGISPGGTGTPILRAQGLSPRDPPWGHPCDPPCAPPGIELTEEEEEEEEETSLRQRLMGLVQKVVGVRGPPKEEETPPEEPPVPSKEGTGG